MITKDWVKKIRQETLDRPNAHYQSESVRALCDAVLHLDETVDLLSIMSMYPAEDFEVNRDALLGEIRRFARLRQEKVFTPVTSSNAEQAPHETI